jgi:rhodanese-related sulfurtransferase
MSKRIELSELQHLIGTGAQIVETLPEPEYSDAHLPGAINIPIKAQDADTTAGLDRARAVVVYCHDYL